MNIDQMRESFAEKAEVGYDVFGQLREDDPRVHIEIRFVGEGEASVSRVDDREIPELAVEAWAMIERDGNDEGMESLLAGFLVGFLHSSLVPVGG